MENTVKITISFNSLRRNCLLVTLMCSALVATFYAAEVSAEESQFGYVYTTDLLPQDQKEVIQWGTLSTKQQGGNFNLFQGRTGLEYGVSDDFQMALYSNYDYVAADHNGIGGRSVAPSAFAGYRVGTNGIHDSKYVGTTVEGIYRVLSPYQDIVGLAVLVEPTYNESLHQIDSRIILQKNFFDDRLVLAGNVQWTAQEMTPNGSSKWARHSTLSFSTAASYRFAPNWSAGLEFVNQHDFDCVCASKYADSVSYIGPSVHYGAEKYFVTLSVLEQLPFAQSNSNSAPLSTGRLLAPSATEYQGRIKFGYYF